MNALPRRRFLLLAAAAGVAGCASRSGPACDGDGTGSGAGYCLVANRRLRVVDGATLPTNTAALVAVDDNTAAILVRDAQGLYALSGICTHACCVVTLCAEVSCASPVPFPAACEAASKSPIASTGAAFLCPCHGSEFDIAGTVLNGPASVDLPTFAVTLDGSDAIIDCSRRVPRAARI